MYPRVTMLVAAAAITVGATLFGAPAAEAQAPPGGPCGGCGPVTPTPDGLLARARSQMQEVNGLVADPPPCNDEDRYFAEDGNDVVEHQGYIRWRLTLNEQDVWDDDVNTTGYRKECWLPTAPDRDGLIEVRIFDAISPQTVAQVAIDDALAIIPTQEIGTSPTARSLVAFDTWFWVEGVPEEGVSATASVPGVSVTATAEPGGVQYSFGDGTGLNCAGAGVAWSPGASSGCTHAYQEAGHYTVTSTILWTGSYTVNGAGPFPITTGIARVSAPLTLPVDEAQAINKVMK